MGQRHQAYIIAKIIPFRGAKAVYRCVGGWHEQWCFGRLPLRATRRFLTLIKQPENAEIIREELKYISGKSLKNTKDNEKGNEEGGEDDYEDSEIPCPYSTFLLGSSFAFGADGEHGPIHVSGYRFRNSVVSASMDPYCGMSNNDGLTVIDITDPENPSYCYDLEPHVPFSAEMYCRAYYPKEDGPGDDEDEDVQRVIDSMANETVMDRAPMDEAWPWRGAPTAYRGEQGAPSISLPSLVDLVLEGAVKQAIKSGDVEKLYPILLVPEKCSSVRGILEDFGLLPLGAVELLMKLNQNSNSRDSVDLSNIKLCPRDVVTVLSQYSGTKLDYLNLSHNSYVTAALLCTIIKAHPHIRRIVLFGTSITNEDMDSLLVSNPRLFCHVDQLIHPAYLSVTSRTSYPQPFSFYGKFGEGQDNLLIIPFFKCTAVLRSLTKYLSLLIREREAKDYTCLIKCNIASMAVFSDSHSVISGLPQKALGERSIAFVPGTTPKMPCPADVFRNDHKGWIFVVKNQGSWVYSFVHRIPSERAGDPTLSIHDLDSFLDSLREEYGEEPDTGVVEQLRETLDKLQVVLDAKPMSSAELDSIVPKLGAKW